MSKRMRQAGSAAASSSSTSYASGGNLGAGHVIGVPSQKKCTLLYSDAGALTTGVNTWGFYVYNLNSIYDPNRTGVGAQPRYHDQLAALYNRYRVDSVDIELYVASPDYGGNIVTLVGANDVGSYIPSTAVELPFCQKPLIVEAGVNRVLKAHFDLAKISAASKTMYSNDDRYQATFNSSPAEYLTGTIGVMSLDNSSVGRTVNYRVRIAYNITCFDRIAVGAS